MAISYDSNKQWVFFQYFIIKISKHTTKLNFIEKTRILTTYILPLTFNCNVYGLSIHSSLSIHLIHFICIMHFKINRGHWLTSPKYFSFYIINYSSIFPYQFLCKIYIKWNALLFRAHSLSFDKNIYHEPKFLVGHSILTPPSSRMALPSHIPHQPQPGGSPTVRLFFHCRLVLPVLEIT